MARRRPAKPAPVPASVLPAPVTNGSNATIGSPPADGGAQTTGRYLIVYKESLVNAPKEAERILRETAGIKGVISAAELDDASPKTVRASEYENTFFPALGVAVCTPDSDQLQSLMSAAADVDSDILAIEPEYVYYAIASPGMMSFEFIRGYRAAVNSLYDEYTAARPALAEVGIAQAFQDTAQFTWGLQATRVSTSRFNGQGVRVAVLDTGMDFQHPDFVGRRFQSETFIPGQAAQDGQGHGTHCVGTSCGPERPPTGVRRYGCAFGADIVVVKVLNNSGSAVGGSVLQGMDFAIRHECQIISMSLGAPLNQVSQAFEASGQRALQAGCLVIAAAGNNARRSLGDPGFVEQPANSPSIMAVAAIDSQLQVADFSARSSAVTGAGGKVDIAAPGVAIFSSVPAVRGTHAFFRGTSMATPHVAGIAAMWCQQTKRTGAALFTTLVQNARQIPGDSRDIGAGLVQAPQ